MTIWRRRTEVRLAQARVARARGQLAPPASALLRRARRRPLLWVGVAAGAGYMLGRLAVRPWRIPGLFAVLGGEVLALSGKAVALAREWQAGTGTPSP
ncbi:MAG TPA: hypothetical protein VFJ04_03430 [Rhodanobacteraceae bacterium]|jgi:hypothetical protein|nr:hypothetical protein [Rhodanobacteraceae bacterium]